MDANRIKRVLVVGAGVMGHSIAQVFAQAHIEVNLMDLHQGILDRAMKRMRANLETLAEFGCVSGEDMGRICDHVHPSTDLAASAQGVDFVLEAVVEVPDIKKGVFSQLDQLCPEHTVIASNTSSLDIFRLAQVRRPERLVVAHWFAPPHIIPLVEVVPGPKTSVEVTTFTAGLVERIGKKPVVMKKFVPSFIVNRIQSSISKAVWEMMEKGWATAEEIDLAVKLSLGIRLPVVGVVQSIDFTGLDLIYDIMKGHGSIRPLVEEKVKQGHLGAKTSKGMYDYGGRSEADILKKRDYRYLKLLDYLEEIKAFEPV
ncbi:MAG: 3-hydroxyacyl-CoA dehydrogenase family protein [Deltaproteobacteria bacterium]|nr:3-hydroxyacyl-CoA dehydrogenase family protein [Deltaproteobacteria bacterium]